MITVDPQLNGGTSPSHTGRVMPASTDADEDATQVTIGIIGEGMLLRGAIEQVILASGLVSSIAYSVPTTAAITTGRLVPADLVLLLRPEDDEISRIAGGPPDPLRVVHAIEIWHRSAKDEMGTAGLADVVRRHDHKAPVPRFCIVLGEKMEGVALKQIKARHEVAFASLQDSTEDLMSILESMILDDTGGMTPAANIRLHSPRAPGDLVLDDIDRVIIKGICLNWTTKRMADEVDRRATVIQLRVNKLAARLGLKTGSNGSNLQRVLVRRFAELGWTNMVDPDAMTKSVTEWADLDIRERELLRIIVTENGGRDKIARALAISRESGERAVAALAGRLGLLGAGCLAIRRHVATLGWPIDAAERPGWDSFQGAPKRPRRRSRFP